MAVTWNVDEVYPFEYPNDFQTRESCTVDGYTAYVHTAIIDWEAPFQDVWAEVYRDGVKVFETPEKAGFHSDPEEIAALVAQAKEQAIAAIEAAVRDTNN